MRNPFETEELLKSLSNYPVTKGDVEGHEFHGNQWVQAGAKFRASTKFAKIQPHDVRIILSRAGKIMGGWQTGNFIHTYTKTGFFLKPLTGGRVRVDFSKPNIPVGGITPELKAQQYKEMNEMEKILQDAGMSVTRQHVFGIPSLIVAGKALVKKSVGTVETIAPDAEGLLDRYKTTPVDFVGLASFHRRIGTDHIGASDALKLKADQLRSANNGQDTDESRKLRYAAGQHELAAQQHFTAGTECDDNSYSTSKVEGGWKPAVYQTSGNAKYASTRAAEMSKSADEATQVALEGSEDA